MPSVPPAEADPIPLRVAANAAVQWKRTRQCHPSKEAMTDPVDDQRFSALIFERYWVRYKVRMAYDSIRTDQMEYRMQSWVDPSQQLGPGCTHWPGPGWRTSAHLSKHPMTPRCVAAETHPSIHQNAYPATVHILAVVTLQCTKHVHERNQETYSIHFLQEQFQMSYHLFDGAILYGQVCESPLATLNKKKAQVPHPWQEGK